MGVCLHQYSMVSGRVIGKANMPKYVKEIIRKGMGLWDYGSVKCQFVIRWYVRCVVAAALALRSSSQQALSKASPQIPNIPFQATKPNETSKFPN